MSAGKTPFTLPPELLRDPVFIAACARWDIGTVFSLVIRRAGITMTAAGRLCDLYPSRVGDYMTGKHQAKQQQLIHRIADGLRIPGRLFNIAPRPWEPAPPEPNPETPGQRFRPPANVSDVASDSPPATYPLTGADSDEEERLRRAVRQPSRLDARVIASLAAVLAAQRTNDDVIGSAPLLQPVRAQFQLVENLVHESRGPIRAQILNVGGQWAHFTAWLHANTGHTSQADRLYDRALEWAIEAGEINLVSETLSMKGQQAWLTGRIGPVIGLSQAAQRDPGAHPGQHAISAAQEARGHAMAGDATACERKLADADTAAARAEQHPGQRPPWLYYHSRPFFDLQRGLAYRYLTRTGPAYLAKAIACLTTGLDGIGDARHCDWAGDYVLHLAIAHAQAGDPEQAAAAAREAAATALATGSTRLLTGTRRLHTSLTGHWPANRTVTELGEDLQAAHGVHS